MVLFNSWGVGTWWDRWMTVHFLSGVVGGLLFRLLGVGLYPTFFVCLSILILWEIFERILKLYEPFVNIVLDLILGGLGAWVAYLYVPIWGANTDWLLLIVTALITSLLSYAGWNDSQRRKQLIMDKRR